MKWCKSAVLRTVVLVCLGTSAAALAAPAVSQTDRPANSPGIAALQKANQENKYLFIFFFSGQDANTAAMRGVFQSAVAKWADRADAIQVFVNDPAEKPLVDKFSVRGAPMPLVLTVAPTGAATRAFPKTFSEAQLQQGFVSPCAARCMRAIQDRHLLLVCVQNGRTQDNQAAIDGVSAFKSDPQYAPVTDVVVLDPADASEQSFLRSLKVDAQTTKAVTLLVTPPGAPVATFTGAVSKAEIVAKLAAAQNSGCPGGKCGPGGCGPKK